VPRTFLAFGLWPLPFVILIFFEIQKQS